MGIYLDNSSTTRPYDEVSEYIHQIQKEHWGNPSSSHSYGMDAEKIIKNAADTIAKSLNANRDNLIFTSGGTESNNMALMQPFYNINKIKGSHVIISEVEHPAVREPVERLESLGAEVTRIPVDSKGLMDVELLRSSIRNNTSIISVMHVNNELGTIQPLEQISDIKEDAQKSMDTNLIFHSDCVQSFCKIAIDLNSRLLSGLDMITVSAHKIHGPKGVGALFTRNINKTKPFIIGGGQQRGLRSGTENVSGIAGFGHAAEISHTDMSIDMDYVSGLRNYLLRGLLSEIPEIRVNSPESVSTKGEVGKCVPHILNVSFAGTRGEAVLHSLEQNGIYVSTQSACSSKKKTMSPVLKAIGLTQNEAEGAIRFSLSKFNSREDMDYTIEITKKTVAKMRKLTRFKP